jgi:undecaprenyl diphosphate synthase
MSNVIQKLVAIVEGLDVQPTEHDIDEKVREIALTLKHIAINADGNRRWAKREGLHPFEGHKKGFVDISPKLFQEAWRLGIHTLTLWCCSTGNIEKREAAEVKNLFSCFDAMINETIPLAKKHKVRIIHLGRKDRIPEYLLNTITTAEQETLNYEKHVLNIAIDYSGRDEILRASIKMLQTKPSDASLFTEKDLEKFLDTHNQPFPNPDLMIRTSGEMRSSGFMAWQSVYTELHYLKIYYPEMSPLELQRSIIAFSNRKRTFSE